MTLLRLILFLLTLTIHFGYVAAQNLFQTVRGSITDKETKMPLTGANILLLESNPPLGATTDSKGNFRIEKVSVGRHSFRISFIGYEDLLLKNLEVTSAHELVIHVELSEKIYNSREVVITASGGKEEAVNEMSVISTRQFTVEETNQFAGSWGDVSRMASGFAGVSTGSDKRNEIIVRGNSPMGMLWRMEGVSIPNPNHFAEAGNSGGAISMINSNLLANSDFASGAFAPEYGNATSAVFDLKMRNGNNEQREYIAQIGVNGIELGAEGPFVKGKQSSYLASYRYSTVALLDKMGISLVESVPDFQDLSLKMNFPLKKGSLSFFAVGGISKAVYKPPADSSKWKNDGERFGYITGSGTAFGGLSWFYPLNSNTYIKTILSSSYYQPYYTEDSTGNDYISRRLISKSTVQQTNILSFLINSRITAKHIIRTGMIINNLNFKDQAFNYLYPATGMELLPLSDRSGSLNLLQAYFQYKYNINENLSISPGFHFLYLLSNRQYSIEPRLAFRWEIAGNHVLSLGFGIHGITQAPQIYYAEVISRGEITLPNKNLGFTRSYQAVLGYDWLFHENWRLKTEIYYQYITDAPSSLDNPTLSLINFNNSDNVFVTSAYEGSGKGINYGLELTVEKFMSRGFYLLLTASLYDSRYLDGNKVWRNTRFNGHYATNLLAGKEFRFGKKKNSSFSISGKITWLGGQRYTPIDIGLSSLAHQAVYIDSLAFSSKFDDFFKIDLRIRYRLNRKKVSHEFAFELGNVLNRKNIENIRFDRYTNTVKYNYDLPLVPLVQYRIEF